MQTILIASQNAHKIDEIRPLLEAAGFLVTDARFHQLPEPAETGATFIDNARIKAQAASQATGMIVLADDSGLSFDQLDGFPGVDTAPYTKEIGGYPQGVEDLFRRLDGRPSDCQYISILVLLFPDGREIIAEGRADGRLIREPRGTSEFGYNRWFESKATGKTFGEMTEDEKRPVNHRALALADLVAKLKQDR